MQLGNLKSLKPLNSKTPTSFFLSYTNRKMCLGFMTDYRRAMPKITSKKNKTKSARVLHSSLLDNFVKSEVASVACFAWMSFCSQDLRRVQSCDD